MGQTSSKEGILLLIEEVGIARLDIHTVLMRNEAEECKVKDTGLLCAWQKIGLKMNCFVHARGGRDG